MKLKSVPLIFLLLMVILNLSAQDNVDFVDVKDTNETIARLERRNENHRLIIASNKERKSFLENRIQTSTSRLQNIEENLAYARETNLELNELNRETRDAETKNRLEASRSELMSVIWILTTEKETLTRQTEEDNDELEFITFDIERRETLIERNNGKIGPMQDSVSKTESKINEISSKLDTIINRLDGLREDVTTNTSP